MWAIKNRAGEYLAFRSAAGGAYGGLRFHHDIKLARKYRTRRGARCARTVYERRYGPQLAAVELVLVEAAR